MYRFCIMWSSYWRILLDARNCGKSRTLCQAFQSDSVLRSFMQISRLTLTAANTFHQFPQETKQVLLKSAFTIYSAFAAYGMHKMENWSCKSGIDSNLACIGYVFGKYIFGALAIVGSVTTARTILNNRRLFP